MIIRNYSFSSMFILFVRLIWNSELDHWFELLLFFFFLYTPFYSQKYWNSIGFFFLSFLFFILLVEKNLIEKWGMYEKRNERIQFDTCLKCYFSLHPSISNGDFRVLSSSTYRQVIIRTFHKSLKLSILRYDQR